MVKASARGSARRVGMIVAGLAVSLGACSTMPTPPKGATPGAYYQDDGPGTPPDDLAAVPDAVPRDEPLIASANRPYTVFGMSYVPSPAPPEYRARGTASWYGKKFHGRRTASGEPYDMYAMTAAHPTLPIPSYLRVTNVSNGRSVVVRVNDRGPFLHRRLIDLSYAAAYKLDYAHRGTAQVEIERVLADEDEPLPAQVSRAPREVGGWWQDAMVNAAQAQAPEAVVPTSDAEASDALGRLSFETLDAEPAPHAPPAVPAAAESDGAESAVWLQLGAFSSRAAAQQALVRAQSWESSSPIRWVIVPRGTLWRVQMGPWPSRSAARRAAADMAAQGFAAPVIATP